MLRQYDVLQKRRVNTTDRNAGITELASVSGATIEKNAHVDSFSGRVANGCCLVLCDKFLAAPNLNLNWAAHLAAE